MSEHATTLTVPQHAVDDKRVPDKSDDEEDGYEYGDGGDVSLPIVCCDLVAADIRHQADKRLIICCCTVHSLGCTV